MGTPTPFHLKAESKYPQFYFYIAATTKYRLNHLHWLYLLTNITHHLQGD